MGGRRTAAVAQASQTSVAKNLIAPLPPPAHHHPPALTPAQDAGARILNVTELLAPLTAAAAGDNRTAVTLQSGGNQLVISFDAGDAGPAQALLRTALAGVDVVLDESAYGAMACDGARGARGSRCDAAASAGWQATPPPPGLGRPTRPPAGAQPLHLSTAHPRPTPWPRSQAALGAAPGRLHRPVWLQRRRRVGPPLPQARAVAHTPGGAHGPPRPHWGARSHQLGRRLRHATPCRPAPRPHWHPVPTRPAPRRTQRVLRTDGTINPEGWTSWFEAGVARPDLVRHGRAPSAASAAALRAKLCPGPAHTSHPAGFALPPTPCPAHPTPPHRIPAVATPDTKAVPTPPLLPGVQVLSQLASALHPALVLPQRLQQAQQTVGTRLVRNLAASEAPLLAEAQQCASVAAPGCRAAPVPICPYARRTCASAGSAAPTVLYASLEDRCATVACPAQAGASAPASGVQASAAGAVRPALAALAAAAALAVVCLMA